MRGGGGGARLHVDQAIRTAGHRDIGPLEVCAGVGRALDDDAIAIDDRYDRPDIEHGLRLRRASIEELDRIAAAEPLLDDHRLIMVDPDQRLSSPEGVRFSDSLGRHGSSSI
jgi:L-alanine-DL-glutamate epimerase-like enolase superfamily enzyme